MRNTSKPSFVIGNYNVIMIVADSCRYDSAKKAKTPFLSSFSELRCAEAPATYTFPSHMSFFLGILPVLIDGNSEYLSGISQIWRSVNARENKKTVAIIYRERNIIDHYCQNDYEVVGAGGVSFFGSAWGNVLPQLFPRFIHFEESLLIAREENIPRQTMHFPLANIEKIVSEIDKSRPFFLFINCPETHIPYDSPFVKVGVDYKKAARKLYGIDSIKHRPVVGQKRLTEKKEKY